LKISPAKYRLSAGSGVRTLAQPSGEPFLPDRRIGDDLAGWRFSRPACS